MNAYKSVSTEEGATFTPWTDGHAIGYHITAPGRPDRWLLLNPSAADDLQETNAFIYLEATEPTDDSPPEQPVTYVTIWSGCTECGAEIPETNPSEISSKHTKACSLHPTNIN